MGRTYRGLDRKFKVKQYQKFKQDRRKREAPEDKKGQKKNHDDHTGTSDNWDNTEIELD